MIFTRKKVRGKQQKNHKEWLDESGQYRIVWRNEVFGVQVRPGYRAMLLCYRSPTDHFEYWGFAGKKGSLYKTLSRAKEVCEKNRKMWEKLLVAASGERKGRIDRIRDCEASLYWNEGFVLRRDPARWALRQADPHELRILFPVGRRKREEDSEDAPTTDSTISSDEQPTDELSVQDGLALNVPPSDECQTNLSPSFEESTPNEPVPVAKAAVKVRKQRAKKPTKAA